MISALAARGQHPDLRYRVWQRQYARVALAALLPLALVACGKSDPDLAKYSGTVSAARFVGSVAADEPRAALVARDILENGGNAADAAAAGLLAMTVTYPVAASLASSGVCVVFKPGEKEKRIDAIEFLPALPPEGGEIPIPGFVRGIGLLQASYGRMRWGQVVVPAETLARNGEPASRAFVQSAQETRPPVTSSPALAPLLASRSGGVRREGEQIPQPQLSALLGHLRATGAADFYQGLIAENLLQDMADAGGKAGADDLRRYVVQVSKPISVPFARDMTLYLTPNQRGGAIAAWLLEQGFRGDTFTLTGSGTFRPNVLAAGIGQAYRGLEAGAPIYEHGSASLSVMDREGGAVACAIGMGKPYGSRVIGKRTGILLPAKPNAPGDEMPYLTAMVAANVRVGQSFMSAASSGGAPSAAALAQAVLYVTAGKTMQPAEALARPRLFQPAPDAPVLFETGIDSALLASLTNRGVQALEVRRLGRVTLAACTDGLPRGPASCRVAVDRRGFGLATGDEF